MMLALSLMLLQAASAEPSQFQSTNVVLGACERYVPLDELVQMDAAVAQSPPEMRQQVAKWRAQGREMARIDRFDYRICSALLRNAFGHQ